jgi:hypothetical protein
LAEYIPANQDLARKDFRRKEFERISENSNFGRTEIKGGTEIGRIPFWREPDFR